MLSPDYFDLTPVDQSPLKCFPDYFNSISTTGQAFFSPGDLPDRRNATVVLGLDETLVYARDTPHVRPFVQEAIRSLPSTSVLLWSAGAQEHVESAVRILDSGGTIFDHIIDRGPDWYRDKLAYKPLEALCRTVIIDDSHSVAIHNSDIIPKFDQSSIDTTWVVQMIARAVKLLPGLVFSRVEDVS